MRLRDRALTLAVTFGAALLLAASWVAPVFAQLDDGDGFDGDELLVPFALGAALVVGGIAYWRSRRSSTRGS
jgi:predicted phage tail protein